MTYISHRERVAPAPPPAPTVKDMHRLTAAFLAVALSALAVGNIPGVLQALDHAGVNLYPALQPIIQSYYQGLTLHGVLNVLVWTTFFICGFLPFVVAYDLQRPIWSLKLGWFTYWLMLFGVVLAGAAMLTNEASVLFTFYPPLKAHPAFYIGLTLVVVGTWLVTFNLGMTVRAWKAEHPGERTPLATFGSIITFAMWTLSSAGLAVLMLTMLIPWSVGIVNEVDPLLARTLFWFTGHPIVYFWLLPAYVSWYALVPKMLGTKLFSETMARTAFLLFLILSIPVGLHHQFTDPGIWEGWKLLHAFFTFGVFFPSLLTFFNMVATLERAGRARGGKGIIRWVFALPWGNPALAAQFLAMMIFAVGGVGGLPNASFNVNLVVHNTTWVVGHFHLTVGTAVTLSFMGISYWLLPYLRGRALWSRRLALVQAWTWFCGMALFSETLHRLGLAGMPRRTAIAVAPYIPESWRFDMTLVGIGGVMLFIGGLLFFLNVVMTLVASRKTADVSVPVAGSQAEAEPIPAFLDRWRPWLVSATTLAVLAYLPAISTIVSMASTAVGKRVW